MPLGAIAFECAAHAAKACPEMWEDADRAQNARRRHEASPPEPSPPWRVYAPPHMTAFAVQALAGVTHMVRVMSRSLLCMGVMEVAFAPAAGDPASA
jgi:hypothetical protein